MVSVTVFGSCVARDVFRYSQLDKYSVESYFARNSITNLFSTPIKVDVNTFPDIDKKMKRAEREWLNNECNKTTTQKLLNTKSEWFIMDLGEERLGFIKTPSNNRISYIKGTVGRYMPEIFGENYEGLSIQKPYDNTSLYWKEKLNQFISIIKSKYEEDHIIILEIYLAKYALDSEAKMHKFNKTISQKEIDKINTYLREMYGFLKEKLPNAKYIKYPTNTYCVFYHRWGLHPLHFDESYYFYAEEAIDNIMNIRNTYTLERLYQKQSVENTIKTKMIKIINSYDSF